MIFLCEFSVHDGTTTNTLYVGTHGIRSGPTDTPANQYYEPRLASVGRIERSMFGSGDGVSAGTTGGQSEVGFGNISVLNGTPYGDADLIDHWKNFAFRSVTIKSLTGEAQSYAQAVTRFVGTIENLVSTNALQQYDLVIHDRLQDLDKPLLTHVYLGTTNFGGTGTVEGDTDLKDQIKQKVWGTVHNVSAVSVNPFDLVWQVSDGQVASIVVYDGGVALTNAGNVGSLAALFATAVAAGSYITCLSLGLFLLGSPPVGSVTADVVEGATAASRTAAQIASRMIAWFQAMYPHLSVSLTSSDVTALDALNSAECGILVDGDESALEAVTRVLNSIGAWMLPRSNSTSMLDLGRLDLPEGSAVASYDFEDNINGNPERIESGDESKGVPAWKLTVRYDQVATVQQASDLFGIVTENDPIRVQYLATEWRQASVENADILSIWPNAPTLTVETRLLTQAAAQAEAARLFEMYSVQRDIWRIRVPMSADPNDDPGIGEVVELTSRNGRMGLGREAGSGDLFRVLGRVDDFDEVPTLELTLYGSPVLSFVASLAFIEPPEPEATNTIAATFAGSGSLSAYAISRSLARANFDGAGSLSAFARSRSLARATFAGTGSLSALATGTGPQQHAAAATFNGASTLRASAIQRARINARFDGAGSLSANATAGGGALDSDTSAWIAAVGIGNVTSGRQTLVDNLIVGLKADGVWPLLDRLWLWSSENTQSALIDLKALATATNVNSTTFTPDLGYACNGTSYIDCNYTPSTHGVNFIGSEGHLSSWYSSVSQLGIPSTSTSGGGSQTHIYVRFTDDNCYARVTSTGVAGFANATTASQHIIGNRSAASATEGYRNGTSMTTGTSTWVGLDTTTLVCHSQPHAMTSIGGSLTPTQATAFYNRLRTYMNGTLVP